MKDKNQTMKDHLLIGLLLISFSICTTDNRVFRPCFERYANHRLVNIRPYHSEWRMKTEDACLLFCAESASRCRSIVYDTVQHICHFFSDEGVDQAVLSAKMTYLRVISKDCLVENMDATIEETPNDIVQLSPSSQQIDPTPMMETTLMTEATTVEEPSVITFEPATITPPSPTPIMETPIAEDELEKELKKVMEQTQLGGGVEEEEKEDESVKNNGIYREQASDPNDRWMSSMEKMEQFEKKDTTTAPKKSMNDKIKELKMSNPEMYSKLFEEGNQEMIQMPKDDSNEDMDIIQKDKEEEKPKKESLIMKGFRTNPKPIELTKEDFEPIGRVDEENEEKLDSEKNAIMKGFKMNKSEPKKENEDFEPIGHVEEEEEEEAPHKMIKGFKLKPSRKVEEKSEEEAPLVEEEPKIESRIMRGFGANRRSSPKIIKFDENNVRRPKLVEVRRKPTTARPTTTPAEYEEEEVEETTTPMSTTTRRMRRVNALKRVTVSDSASIDEKARKFLDAINGVESEEVEQTTTTTVEVPQEDVIQTECSPDEVSVWMTFENSQQKNEERENGIDSETRHECQSKCDEVSCRSFTFIETASKCVLSANSNGVELKQPDDGDFTASTSTRFCYPNSFSVFNGCSNFVAFRDYSLKVTPAEEFEGLPSGYEGTQLCVELCVLSNRYTCRSATFNPKTGKCRLLSEDSLTMPDDFKYSEFQKEIYFENGCASTADSTKAPDEQQRHVEVVSTPARRKRINKKKLRQHRRRQ